MGSHAAHLLLRSGVGRLRLIDFDQVSLSSLNRHALATRADVGMPKATCLKVGPTPLIVRPALLKNAPYLGSLSRAPTAPLLAAWQEHFQQMVPEAEVDARVSMYTADSEEELLSGNPDYVIDAIDNIDTKVLLLIACKRRGIPVLCVAGAGAALSAAVRLHGCLEHILSEAGPHPLQAPRQTRRGCASWT